MLEMRCSHRCFFFFEPGIKVVQHSVLRSITSISHLLFLRVEEDDCYFCEWKKTRVMRLDMLCDGCKDHIFQKIIGYDRLEMDPEKKTLIYSDKDNVGMLELNHDQSIFKALVSEALLEGLSEEETFKYHKNFGKDGIESFLREAECDHLVTDRVISFMKSLQVKNRSKYLEAMSNDDMMKILDRDADAIAMLVECSGNLQKDALLAVFSSVSFSKDAAEGKDSLGWLSDDSFLKFMLCMKDSRISFHRLFTDKQIKDLIIRLATITADEPAKKLLPFSYSKNNGGLFSIRAFCPLSYMSPPESNLDYCLDQNMLEAIIQLKPRVAYYRDLLELSISIDNVRCKVSPLPNNAGKDSGEGRHNLCRLLIELEPVLNDRPGSIHSLKAGKSTSYPASSFRYYKWLHHLGESKHNVGYFDWALCQMDSGSRTWNAVGTYNYYYSRDYVSGDVVFSDDIYGEPLTWRTDKSNLGKEVSLTVKTSVWVASAERPESSSYCVLHWSFSNTVPIEL